MGRGTHRRDRTTRRGACRRVRRARVSLAWALALAAGPAAAENAGLHTVLFSSLEAGASTFSTSGAKLAFDRFDRDGPVVLVSGGSGIRLEGGGRLPVLVRTTLLGAALGGYQFVRDWGVVTVLAGPELSVEMLAGAGRAEMLPLRSGVRLHGEVWARPTEATLATATVILGSARSDAWARLSWGYAVFGAYLGPEAAAYLDHTGYRKWSLGLHATDYAFGGYRFRLSAGCQFEGRVNGSMRPSPYLGLAIWNAL